MKITKANGVVEYQLLAQLKQRAGETDPKITEAVTTIINGVKEGGDEAVREYTVRFDGSVPKKIEFDKDEIHDFLDQVDPAFKDTVVKAQQNIYDFHQRQAQQSWMTRQNRRCTGNHYGDPAWQGRQSQSQYYGGCRGGRCG